MKTVIILLFVFCYVESRKILQPLDKNANIAFINMEGGGGTRPNTNPAAQATPVKPVAPAQAPTPAPAPVTKPFTPPASPKDPPKTPVVAPVGPPKPVTPSQPSQNTPAKPSQIAPKPVNPPPVANPITTPGPGSVKQLVTFYDSQGKASQIRPYSYSQAVKQG